MQFNIVTPVLNGGRFINETIISVVSQAGPFLIHYHVQDGGSADSTINLLRGWQKRLANDFPINCAGIKFSFSSEPDRGLYDAVNRGFAASGKADFMAWINADDRYEPGAFFTVAEIFGNHSDIDWVTGRPTVINETGGMLHISPIIPFPRKAIAAGVFEGRFARPFIQQESTFWRSVLWEKTGGLNADFRVAGDFDLWRRFAMQSDLVIIDAILACFRERAGQLSGDIGRYHAEIDASLSADEIATRAKISKRYAKAGFEYRVLVRNRAGQWVCKCRPMCLLPFRGDKALRAECWRVSFLEWFDKVFIKSKTFDKVEKTPRYVKKRLQTSWLRSYAETKQRRE
jgi:glycosyltransferase involved in cell wall biosynthesis